MKKMRFLVTMGSLVLVLVLIALPFMVDRAKPALAASPAWQWPKLVSVGTPQLGTAQYANTLAWGSLMEKDTKMSVRLSSLAGTVDRYKVVKSGAVTFVTIWPSDSKFGLEATGGYASEDAGPFEMRVFWTSNIAYWGFPVLANSPVKTLQDLKGRKIAWYEGSPMFVAAVRAALAYAGLSTTDVTVVPVGDYAHNIKGISERRFDTAFVCPSSGLTYELEGTPGGIRWLPISTPKENPQGIARWLKMNPVETFGKCSIGVKSSIGIHMVLQPQYYVTRADTDPELTYRMTKWIANNYTRYKDANVAAKTLDLNTFKESVVEKIFIPVHDGVLRYLKEKNMWSAEDEARQSKYIALIKQYVEAYDTAIKTAKEKGMATNHKNKQWVELWEKYKKERNLPPFSTP